ncbi:HAMP domain-containing protein [Salinicoccus hispanicus]|uniref:histidine kinase n=2 Tax=Salinicoccus hispanicus TaxID=157225 RepID=A0A6N8TYZ2_9STAP|nr:HAMP domain-containing protein [Salinicoccus hispanicus]
MRVINSIVTKLWLTIILIVTTVLIILSVILSMYFRNYVLNSTETLLNEEISRLEEIVLAEHDIEDMDSVLLREDNLIFYTEGRMISHQSAADEAIYQRIMDGEGTGTTFILEDVYNHDYMVKVSNLSSYFDSDVALIKYRDLEDINQSMRAVTIIIIGSAFVLFLITTSFAFFLINRITRPLINLRSAAFSTAKGNYNTLEVKSRDEIGELTLAFNKMNNDIKHNISEITHERNLREQIFTYMNEGVLYYNGDAELIYSNQKGHELHELIRQHQSESARFTENIREIAKNRESAIERMEMESRHLQFSYTPVEEGDVVYGVILLVKDITEEVGTEKMRSEFIANVSHELKTPMVMLSGYSEALLDDIVTDPAEIKEMIGIIKDESDRMNTMVNELITIARMDSRSDFFHIEKNDFGQLLDKLASRFRHEMSDNGIKFAINANNDDMVFDFDYDKLSQVFTNLLDNAIRYTSEGDYITINVDRTERYFVINVTDTGTGIRTEHQKRIFERFYKVDESRTRGQHGTGLGLYIVKSIIHRHNGSIELDSTFGKGTTFRITLPKKHTEE